MSLLGFREQKKSDGTREGVLSHLLLQRGGPGSQKCFPQATPPLMGGARHPFSISDLVDLLLLGEEGGGLSAPPAPQPLCLALCPDRTNLTRPQHGLPSKPNSRPSPVLKRPSAPPCPGILSSFSPRSSSLPPSSSPSLSTPLPAHLLRFHLVCGVSLGFLSPLPATLQHVPLGHSFALSVHLADINSVPSPVRGAGDKPTADPQLPAQKGGVDMPSGCPKPVRQNLPSTELFGLPRESDLSLGAASANGTSTVTGEVGHGGCLRSAEGVPKKWRLFQAGWG